jgi:hypothetical protein
MKQEDVFWRSRLCQAGRATVAFKKGGKRLASQAGDVSCIHPTRQSLHSALRPWSASILQLILNFQGLLTGKGKLLAFWAEINEQARRYSKHPFMIARPKSYANHGLP